MSTEHRPSQQQAIMADLQRTLSTVDGAKGCLAEMPSEDELRMASTRALPFFWVWEEATSSGEDSTGLYKVTLPIRAVCMFPYDSRKPETTLRTLGREWLALIQSALFVDPRRGTDSVVNAPYAEDTKEDSTDIMDLPEQNVGMVLWEGRVKFNRSISDPRSQVPQAA